MAKEKEYTYDKINEIKKFLMEKTAICPKVGIICGTGLGSMGETIKEAFIIEYKDIPHFPISTVTGHKGRVIFGYISNTAVVCLQGRFHHYEGYPLSKCIMPVQLMKLLGVTYLIISNAAGSVNRDFKVGDIMLIKDHFDFMGLAGNGGIVGLNDERFGPRFVSMINAYDKFILQGVKKMSEEIGLKNIIREGVYTCVGGPSYETVAEIRALNALGIDAVGMSTVHEIIAARQCGITCFAFSLITNIGFFEYDNNANEPNNDEVVNVGKSREKELKMFVENVVDVIRKQCMCKNK